MPKDELIPLSNDGLIPLKQEEELIPLKTEGTVEGRHAARPTWERILRQTAAIPFDIGSGLVSTPGALVGLVETGIRAATGESLSDSFAKGMDNASMRAGNYLRDKTNELLDIPEPNTAGEMVVRDLLGAAIPLPGNALSKIGLVGRYAKAADTAINLATPLVKLERGKPLANIGRIAAQGGVGFGIGQASRYYDNDPRTLTAAQDLTGSSELIPLKTEPTIHNDHVVYDSPMDKNLSNYGYAALGVGVALYGANKWKQFQALKAVNDPTVNPTGGANHPTADLYSISEKAKQGISNESAAITQFLKKAGAPDDVVERLGGEILTGPGNVRQHFITTGEMGPNNRTTKSPVQMLEEYYALPDDVKAQYAEYSTKLHELSNRVRATIHKMETGELPILNNRYNVATPDDVKNLRKTTDADTWMNLISDMRYEHIMPETGWLDTGSRSGHAMLKNIDLLTDLNRLRNNTQILDIQRTFAEVPKAILKHGVSKNVFSQDWADEVTRAFTMFGEVQYMPGTEIRSGTKISGMDRLLNAIGWRTPEADGFEALHNFKTRATEYGQGLVKPVNPITDLPGYIDTSLAYINRMDKTNKFLDYVMGVAGALPPNLAKQIVYVREVDPFAKTTDQVTRVLGHPELLKNADVVKGDLANEMVHQNKFIRTQANGKFYDVYVENDGLRHALEFAPAVPEGILGVMNKARQVVQELTTRNPLTLFAPTAGFYNVVQMGLTAKANKLDFNPIIDPVQGMFSSMKTDFARDFSQLFHHFAANNGAFGISARTFETMALKLQRVYEQSFLGQAEKRGFGPMQADLKYNTNLPGMVDHAASYVPYVGASDVGAVFQAGWRSLKIVNKALHDGASVGTMLRNFGVDDEINKAVMKRLADAGGNMGAQGSNRAIQAMNSMIPYNNVMIQAMTALGMAAKRNPAAFGMGLTMFGIAPTIIEYMWNRGYLGTISPEDQERYKQMTPEQRNNNFLFMNGDNPISAPVVPELGFIKALVTTALDTVFGDESITGIDHNQQEMAAAFARMFNITLPPLARAAVNTTGYDISLTAPIVGGMIDPDPTQKGQMAGIKMSPLSRGEQVSGYDRGTNRYMGGIYDTVAEAMIANLTGALGAHFIRISEAFGVGVKESFGTGIEYAFGETGKTVKKSLGFSVPGVFTREIAPNAHSTDIAEEVRRKDAGLDKISKDVGVLFSGPLTSGGSTLLGAIPEVEKAGIYQTIITNVETFKEEMSAYKKELSELNRQKQSVASSARLYDGTVLSYDDQQKLLRDIDRQQFEIYTRKAVRYKEIEDSIKESTGVQIDISTFGPHLVSDRPKQRGPNLP